MRTFLKSTGRYLSVGWFWVVVLLALPKCGLSTDIVPGPRTNLVTGSSPHTAAIMCDIEKERHCATDAEKASGIRLTSAAEALVAGQGTSNKIGLDYSPAALARCGGQPEAVEFRGDFPKGLAVCLNCGDSIKTDIYSDTNAACVAQCEDFLGTTNSAGIFTPNVPPLPADQAFCAAHAHASTNFPLHDCYADACTTAGVAKPNFADPRISPELVIWQGVTANASASPGTLSRSTMNMGAWDAGAYSDSNLLITGGDAYVEFVADVNTKARVCGLSSGAADTDPSYTDIGYGIDLFSDGQISIFEKGTRVKDLGAYSAGDKFRVKVTDNFDLTASISYVKVTGSCADGSPCTEVLLYTSTAPGTYPFRVDASLFDQGASLTKVRLVRIH